MDGTWSVTASTPLGRIDIEMRITTRDGVVSAVVAGSGQHLQLDGIRIEPQGDGERVRWSQQLTEPMRIRVAVDVLVVGDTLSGTAKAGIFPRSKVSGRRIG